MDFANLAKSNFETFHKKGGGLTMPHLTQTRFCLKKYAGLTRGGVSMKSTLVKYFGSEKHIQIDNNLVLRY